MSRRAATSLPPLTLVIDTREPLASAYDFASICPTPPVRKKLDVGDYSILGHEHVIAWERKDLGDLFSTIISNRARFEREIARAATLTRFTILVEGTVRDVLGYWASEAAKEHWKDRWGTPLSDDNRKARCRSVLNSLNTWTVEHGIFILFVDRDRAMCRAMVYRQAERYWRQVHTSPAAAPSNILP